jgi:putative RecB family exonuclease
MTPSSEKRYVRSWSQASEFLPEFGGCPYSFFLGRIEKVWKRPAAWFPFGTAVHAAAERWERSGRTASMEELVEEFNDVYTIETNSYLEETPNTDVWMWSGRYDGATDIARRREIGPVHLTNLVRWYQEHPQQLPWRMPDGQLAVELPFEIDLGSVPVRGVIDWIGWVSADRTVLGLAPRDIKAGSTPGKPMQLKIYGLVLENYLESIGVENPEVKTADFFMTKEGKPKGQADLTTVSRDEVVVAFERMHSEVEAGNFPPNPDPDRCRRCSVNFSCTFRQD